MVLPLTVINCVYLVTHPDHPGLHYVGETSKSAEARWKGHITDALSGKRDKFHRAMYDIIMRYASRRDVPGWYEFEIRVLHECKTKQERWEKQGIEIGNYDAINNGWNTKESHRYRTYAKTRMVISPRDRGDLEFYEVGDIHKKLGISKSTFEKKLRELGDIEKAAEESLDAAEKSQQMWFVEGHRDKPFSNLEDLVEGGVASYLNPQKLTKASIQERRLKYAKEGDVIRERKTEFMDQVYIMIRSEALEKEKKKWLNEEFRLHHVREDGRVIDERGTFGELHYRVKSMGKGVCYNGESIRGYTTILANLRHKDRDWSNEVAFGIVVPRRYQEAHQLVMEEGYDYYPPLEGKKKWIHMSERKEEPLVDEELRIVFRGISSIPEYAKEKGGPNFPKIDTRTIRDALKGGESIFGFLNRRLWQYGIDLLPSDGDGAR